MKTRKIFATVALAMAFNAPSAAAEPHRTKTVRMTFAYTQAETPESVYQRLERKARRTCESTSILSASMLRATESCQKELVDAAILKIERIDVASIHYLERAQEMAALW